MTEYTFPETSRSISESVLRSSSVEECVEYYAAPGCDEFYDSDAEEEEDQRRQPHFSLEDEDHEDDEEHHDHKAKTEDEADKSTAKDDVKDASKNGDSKQSKAKS